MPSDLSQGCPHSKAIQGQRFHFQCGSRTWLASQCWLLAKGFSSLPLGPHVAWRLTLPEQEIQDTTAETKPRRSHIITSARKGPPWFSVGEDRLREEDQGARGTILESGSQGVRETDHEALRVQQYNWCPHTIAPNSKWWEVLRIDHLPGVALNQWLVGTGTQMPLFPHPLRWIIPQSGDYTDSQRPPANYLAVVTGLIKHPLLFAFTSPPHFRTPLTVSPGCILQINKLFALLSLTRGLPLEPNPRQRGLKSSSIHESSLVAGETSHMHINQDAQL